MQALRSSSCVVLLLCFLPALVRGDAKAELADVQDEFFQWQQQMWPIFATEVRNNEYNDRLDDLSIDVLYTQFDKVSEFYRNASKIDRDRLSRQDQYNYDTFLDMLYTFIYNNAWLNHGPLNPINFMEGFYLQLDYIVDSTPLDTKKDFENYIARLEARPTQINQIISRMNRAIEKGTTNHIVSMKQVPGQIAKVIGTPAQDSVLYRPFNDKLDSLDITQAERKTIRSRGLSAVEGVWAALGRLKTYIQDTYMHNTRTTYGVYGLPSGEDYYNACLKWHLSMDKSAEQVHNEGKQEVERITQEMRKVMTRQKFQGTVRQYYQKLKADPQFKLSSVDEILAAYRSIVFDRISPKLLKLFKEKPSHPLVVKPLPFDGPYGMYRGGTEDGKQPGTFYVNVFRPNDTNTFSMVSLSLHEALPGHHMEAATQMDLDLPKVQKYLRGSYFAIPFEFSFYTAYSEGWGLYSEYLGEEMGVYADDYELMGRYGEEMLRACRLVVDTGLHFLKWSREKAIQYVVDRTPMSRTTIEIEIDRYITWPGQACAYKMGELKIKELRQKASKALGSKFDVRDFHYLLLNNGRIPLRVMETIIDDYIADRS